MFSSVLLPAHLKWKNHNNILTADDAKQTETRTAVESGAKQTEAVVESG